VPEGMEEVATISKTGVGKRVEKKIFLRSSIIWQEV